MMPPLEISTTPCPVHEASPESDKAMISPRNGARARVIHVLYACTSHEGDCAVRAFADKARADAVLAKIRAHLEKKPSAPSEVLDTPENDAAFDRYWTAYERWAKRHPAGRQFATHDDFAVQPLPFNP